MATHDYIIENQTFINFRADLNFVLSAIVSNNSSLLEPTTTYAYMWWADTTAGLLKQRNSSNTGWVDILDLTTGATVATGVNDLLNAVSDGLAANIGLGENALASVTSGTNNTALGESALNGNTAGIDNTGIGRWALTTNWLGNGNTGVGVSALGDNNLGNRNTAVGQKALGKSDGQDNTAVGQESGLELITGNFNTLLGTRAGNNITTENYTITIGYNVAAIGTDYITMGKNGALDNIYNQFTANATWTRVSDERVKKEIYANTDCGLDFVNDLQTVTYKFKAPSELDPSLSEYDKDNDKPSHDKPMYGFIAQQVKETLDRHGIKNFAGHHQIDDGKDNMQGISYEMFVMPLVKAVQELSGEVDSLRERLEALENK